MLTERDHQHDMKGNSIQKYNNVSQIPKKLETKASKHSKLKKDQKFSDLEFASND